MERAHGRLVTLVEEEAEALDRPLETAEAAALGEHKRRVARDMRLEERVLGALAVTSMVAVVAAAAATMAAVEGMERPVEEGLPTPVAPSPPTRRATRRQPATAM